jgi:SulP family sulfate permease
LRETFAQGYGTKQLGADVLAGLVVGVVALPLSMALAIASGVPPQHGLYTAILGGALIALLGGSRTQVSGPTAAFVVILAPIAAAHGVGGLLLATAMAGVILMCMGLARLGSLVEFIPYPVTTGFTAGIAVVIGTLQLKDLLGLQLEHRPEGYFELLSALWTHLPAWNWPDLALGVGTLLILMLWPRVSRKIPAPLVALSLAGLAAWWLERNVAGLDVATIRERFSYSVGALSGEGIPPVAPSFGWPWNIPDSHGVVLEFNWATIRALAPSAFAIAMLGAIESLLSAVVADGMLGSKHDPDAELFAQGAGNLIAPFFGGIAATGAIARTATNIRAGAHSPIAAVVHALFVLLAVVSLAPLLGYLPMAAMAALLLLVAWNMSEMRHVARALRTSPRGDVLVLLTCLGLTVAFDMVIAVSVGFVLAALLFMRRMASVSEVNLLAEQHPAFPKGLPRNVLYYEIAGPLFFGAAQRAMSALHRIRAETRVVVLDLRAVPVIDATGLFNLESALGRLKQSGVFVILAGVHGQPLDALRKTGIGERPEHVFIADSIEEAVARAVVDSKKR